MLRDHTWRIRYTPDDGDLVRLFYVPALQDAVLYHRLTGYFNAGALALAARGIEGLVRNNGRARLLVGCTLEAAEIDAIERGEALRQQVERRLAQLPLSPPDAAASGALELLAWMVGRGFLDVKVAVPCNAEGVPVPDSAIFHEKAGIVEDGAGDRIAWNGSLNETPAGWQRNWESLHVYTSWGAEPERVRTEEGSFARLWANRSPRLAVLDVPSAVRQDLMRFLPKDDVPRRLQGEDVPERRPATPPRIQSPPPPVDLRTVVWRFIQQAPTMPAGGDQVGVATAAVEPWPHQARAFERLYAQWPPKLLIADEVGLGKTIQAGMFLRQAWLAGKAKRVLVLAPKAVLAQWQIELREKFNLDWPIYDGRALRWADSPARRVLGEPEPGASAWHEQPAVIASSQLMRRQERTNILLEEAKPWDVIVLDEAHHARRRSMGAKREDRPNRLLRLMRGLKARTQGLLLLTATPMQVHPVETWDLLDLLGLPAAWTSAAFMRFFEDVEAPNPSAEAMERLARLFRSAEGAFGEVSREEAEGVTRLSRLGSGKLLRALRDESTIPRRQLDAKERRAALALMRSNTPIRHLVSRHTRQLLRRYAQAGRLGSPIAERDVEDRFLPMTAAEQALYEAVETFISTTYDQAAAAERSAVGFVMTVYRRRVASSFQALRRTFERRLAGLGGRQAALLEHAEEDAPDDELSDIDSAEEVERLARDALVSDERSQIVALLERARALPPDSKLAALQAVLAELRQQGYGQAMVFTQFTDTMDFLRDALRDSDARLMCFSGRGGEVPASDGGAWRRVGRDDAKRSFRDGEADVLLCTDAAAEGLNFQFCGAVVNYDMPWNPMRVEQRIGRIDRLGQEHPRIRIVNLHYEGTVETDVYRALRERIRLFESVVGRLQPILAQLPGTIASAVLARTAGSAEAARRNAVAALERQAAEAQAAGFDLDAAVEADQLEAPPAPPSPVTMDDLEQVIARLELMPPDAELRRLRDREYGLRMAGMAEFVRVTTDPAFFQEHAESVELWSPGGPLFKAPEGLGGAPPPSGKSLREVLAQGPAPRPA